MGRMGLVFKLVVRGVRFEVAGGRKTKTTFMDLAIYIAENRIEIAC